MNSIIKTKSRFNVFIRGFVSTFKLSSDIALPDTSAGFERDAQALSFDWQCVGLDMQKAMNNFVHAK